MVILLPLFSLAQNSTGKYDKSLIPFANIEGKWGYLDAESLEVKIEPKYDFAHLFKNGVAEVGMANPNSKNYNDTNLYGLIDAAGNELFKPQFPYRYDVKTRNDSILPNLIEYVTSEGKKGIAKTDGTWLIPLGKYDWFDFYSKKLIIADKHFIIHNGKTVELPKDYKVKWIDLENKLVHFEKNEMYEGIATLTGKIVVPPKYIEINYYPESKRFLASKPKHKLTKSNALRMLKSLVSSDDQEGAHTYLLDENGKEIAFFKSRYYPDVDKKTGIGSFEKDRKTIYFSMKTGDYLKESNVIGQSANYYVFEAKKLKGVKNSSGEIVIPANYKRLHFWNSTKLIATNAQNYKEGLIDVQGKTILSFDYESLYGAGFGKLTASTKNGFGLITKKGKVLTDFQFRNGIYFGDDGFASVYSEGKNGVVDSTGKMVVPMKYDDIFNIHQLGDSEKTYFTASKDGKWGLLDSTGKMLIPFEYGSVSIEKENFKLGWVSTEDKNRKHRGAINLETGVEIQPAYDFLKIHKNFIIAAQYENNTYKYILLNSSGEKLSDAVYSEMDYKHGYLLARKNKKYGILDIHGKTLIPFEYDYIWTKTKNLMMVQKGETYFYMNIDGKKYLPKKSTE